MDPFLQDPPRASNRFRTDRTLRYALERTLPADAFAEAAPSLDALGERVVAELQPLGRAAEANPPRLVPFGPWGDRIDQIQVDPAWTRLVAIGQEEGIVAIPREGAYGPHARAVQFGVLNLFMPGSATADCPLAMTDAAVTVLEESDPALAARYVPRLTARTGAWTSGQWMTEKEGGSDVGRTGTTATEDAQGSWLLRGTKWFTSATTADIALALARPDGAGEGSRALSLFLLELRRPDGSWNGIRVRRLKDKLGTKALPTAELDLDGTIAVPVGGLGRGVAKISPMLNITRLHAAVGSLAGIGHALDLARDYATRREAFGRLLHELPLHRAWIASVAATYDAATALTARAAELLGATERGDGDAVLTRVVLPLTKLAVARQSVWAVSELVESFGGAGYVEDTGLPQILRDVHVNCIWEGTTSVMALDTIRALATPGASDALVADIERAARAAGAHDRLAEVVQAVEEAMRVLKPMLAEPTEQGARRLAWGLARTYEAALAGEAAAWALTAKGDPRPATAAVLFAREPLVGSEPLGDDELGALAFDRL